MSQVIRPTPMPSEPLSALVGLPGGGWSLDSISSWLVTEGRRLGDFGRLIQGLFERLEAARAPVWRVRIGIRTINPVFYSHAVEWWRGKDKVGVWQVGHAITESDDYRGSPIQWVHQNGITYRRRLTQLEPSDHSVLHSIRGLGGFDYLAIPIIFTDGQINVMTLSTDRADGFSDADIAKFEALINLLTPILESIAVRRLATSLLDTYLGHRTGQRVLNGQFKRGDAETLEAALWFSDLRDFTPITESLSAEEMLATLNAYFEFVAAATTSRGGEILRFIGDAMLIVFPTAQHGDLATACQSALDAAEDAFASLATANVMRRHRGEPEINFGVGLHAGTVVYGNVGAPDRLDFTVMGTAVNRTARLEGLTKKLGRPLLLSAEVASLVKVETESLGAHEMKGVAEPQEVFCLKKGACSGC
ncbi:MAG: adenylate/guanylate cyclase domain-containing protein [Magnetovibrionaceae bacterium]